VILEAVRGDITTQDLDAVVNAANSSLLGGGGVDGAIHAAAGPDLLEQCRAVRRETWIDGLPTGRAVATGAGRMRARFVIHTVGPKNWEHADGGAELLADCHLSVLEEADRVGASSVAFPAISCGVFGWEAADAAPIAVAAVRKHFRLRPGSPVELVRFVLFDDVAHAHFVEAITSVE